MPKIKPYEIGYWLYKNDSYDNFYDTVLATSPDKAKEQILILYPSAKLLATL
jgi:hypothetical protein